ncbi:hypothetical protein SDC9_135958 [bioreactor metagenome]|uniref:Uncharacterized protein n=1 Tax=bioreactor metagenome TaxID=1076179 RepID=A0A645DHA0_9ZZZZ
MNVLLDAGVAVVGGQVAACAKGNHHAADGQGFGSCPSACSHASVIGTNDGGGSDRLYLVACGAVQRDRAAGGEQRLAVEGHGPAVGICTGQIEFPEIAQVVARIDHIGLAVAVQIHQRGRGQAVVGGIAATWGSCVGGNRDELQLFVAIQVLNQKHRALLGAVIAIAHHYCPAAIVHARDLRGFLQAGGVAVWAGGDIANICVISYGCGAGLHRSTGERAAIGCGFAIAASTVFHHRCCGKARPGGTARIGHV